MPHKAKKEPKHHNSGKSYNVNVGGNKLYYRGDNPLILASIGGELIG